MKECLALIKHGISEETAFSLSANVRTAMVIMFGELEGGTFDWNRQRWNER